MIWCYLVFAFLHEGRGDVEVNSSVLSLFSPERKISSQNRTVYMCVLTPLQMATASLDMDLG